MTKLHDLQPSERIGSIGHRPFVGGNDPETWYGIGRLQYHFLVREGLRPHHRFLDIACGALRLGQYLIPFLDRGNYFGLEAEPELVRIGLEQEFNFGIAEMKAPNFAYGYDFDFSFIEEFDFAIAQSLFTHLTLDDIALCFANLRARAGPQSKFFFTFHEGDDTNNPDNMSDPHLNWRYRPGQFAEIGERSGWQLEYVGDWAHPRDQKLMCATTAG